ncbi:MAG: hypothetical protein GXO70_00020 [Acidobacteria bacterium]|nr:hypothetical protein [Acidobacteriota bacterium]
MNLIRKYAVLSLVMFFVCGIGGSSVQTVIAGIPSLNRLKQENRVRFLVADKTGRVRDIIFSQSRGYKGNPEQVAHAFINEYGNDLGFPADQFVLLRKAVSGDETIVWLQQMHLNLPVFYGRAYFVVKSNHVEIFRDSVERTFDEEKLPILSPLMLPHLYFSAIPGTNQIKEGPVLGYFRGMSAYRAVVIGKDQCWEAFLDAGNGKLMFKRNMIHDSHEGVGMVFHPNPISTTGDITLTDNNDADSDVLNNERVQVTLHLLDDASGKLKNQYVDLTAPGMGSRAVPGYTPGMAQSDTGEFNFTRNDFRFEEVNAYYWITELSRYIAETLGFPERVNYSVPVNVHYMSDDNSYYMETDRGLHYGDGGVDDAEDSEIVLHEFGHAIQHNAIPGLGQTWDAGSQDEGTSDYISATFSGDTRYSDTLGEWDAICYDPNPDHDPPRLRPIVTNRHYPENMREPYPLTGKENIHWDGVIWSSTLWQVRNHIGANHMDSILMKALPTMAPDTYYPSSAVRLLNAEISLYGGQYRETLHYFFTRRGILVDNYILNPQTDSEPFHLYFPLVREDEDFTSHIGIINPTADDVLYSIQVIGDNGCLVYSAENGTIPGNGRIWLNPLKAKVQAPCWVMLSSSAQLAGYTSLVSRDLDRSSFLPAVSNLSEQLVVPHIAPESDYWDTETALVNVSDQIPVVNYLSPGEEVIALNSLNMKFGETSFDWLTDVYGGAYPETFSGWGIISSDIPVLSGVETFRKKGEDIQQLAGFVLKDSSNTGPVLYFPHVDVQGVYWWTGIALENVSENDTELTLTPYDENGTALEAVTFPLSANSKVVDIVQNFWATNGKTYPTATAWVKAEAGNGGELVGFELFGTLEGKGDRLLAGVPGASEPVTGLIFPHVSNDPDYWTGIAVLNTGSTSCTLTVEALDNSGTVLQTENPVDLLQPNEKWVLLAKDIFTGGLPVGTTQIRVHGDEPMVGFELWGNLMPQQDYISGISAIPIVFAE